MDQIINSPSWQIDKHLKYDKWKEFLLNWQIDISTSNFSNNIIKYS